MMALVIEPDTRARMVDTETDLDSIKALIGGGWLENVAGVLPHWIAYGDEEGRLKGMDPNPAASMLAQRAGAVTDMLVGTVVFFGLTESDNPEDGLVEFHVPPELVELAQSYVAL